MGRVCIVQMLLKVCHFAKREMLFVRFVSVPLFGQSFGKVSNCDLLSIRFNLMVHGNERLIFWNVGLLYQFLLCV